MCPLASSSVATRSRSWPSAPIQPLHPRQFALRGTPGRDLAQPPVAQPVRHLRLEACALPAEMPARQAKQLPRLRRRQPTPLLAGKGFLETCPINLPQRSSSAHPRRSRTRHEHGDNSRATPGGQIVRPQQAPLLILDRCPSTIHRGVAVDMVMAIPVLLNGRSKVSDCATFGSGDGVHPPQPPQG